MVAKKLRLKVYWTFLVVVLNSRSAFALVISRIIIFILAGPKFFFIRI